MLPPLVRHHVGCLEGANVAHGPGVNVATSRVASKYRISAFQSLSPLPLPTAPKAVRPPQIPPLPPPAPAETRAELAPAAAEALVAIVDDGDSAIRDLSACIDRYNTLRTSFNHHVQSP